MENKELNIGDDVITSRGLFGKVTSIQGDIVYVKLGGKDVPISRQQVTLSEGNRVFHVTYTINGDDTEYIMPMLLARHTIVYDDKTDLKTLCTNQIFNRTGKRCSSIKIIVA